MKKIVSLLFALLLTATLLLPVGVAAANPVTKEGLYYEIEDGKVIIVDCVETTSGDLKIPAEIDGKPVTAIRNTAFYRCVQLASVTIPEGVTSIGDSAFGGCLHLSEITIPKSVTSIGMDAFHDTAYYNNEENWEEGLLYIDGCVVASREDVTQAVVREDTRLIAGDVFFGRAITAASLPDTVTVVGARAFGQCASLTEVYYGGKEAEWKKVAIADGNEALTKATKHYESQLKLTEDKKKKFDLWLFLSILFGVLTVVFAALTVLNYRKEKKAAAAQGDEQTASESTEEKVSTEKKKWSFKAFKKDKK